VPEKPKELID